MALCHLCLDSKVAVRINKEILKEFPNIIITTITIITLIWISSLSKF